FCTPISFELKCSPIKLPHPPCRLAPPPLPVFTLERPLKNKVGFPFLLPKNINRSIKLRGLNPHLLCSYISYYLIYFTNGCCIFFKPSMTEAAFSMAPA